MTFMMRVRGGAPFESGMTVVGFWMGLTLGRVILGFVTGKIGERLAVIVCFTSSLSVSLETPFSPCLDASDILNPIFSLALGLNDTDDERDRFTSSSRWVWSSSSGSCPDSTSQLWP